MEILFMLFGIAALFFVIDSMTASGEDDAETAPDDTEGSGQTDDDTPDDDTEGSGQPDEDTPDDDTDGPLPVIAFDPDNLPQGIFFYSSDPGAQFTNFMLNISDELFDSIILQGGVLQMDSTAFNPDAFDLRAFEYTALEDGKVIDTLSLRADGALVMQHPDADAPLIIEGGDFNRLIGDFDMFDLRAAEGGIELRPAAGAVILGGEGFLDILPRGDSTIILGAGEAVLVELSNTPPNEIVTGAGRVVLSITPGTGVTAAEGQGINGAIELRVAEGNPADGPSVIEDFDVAQSQLLLWEFVDQSGPDTRAPISLSDSDAGLQVFAGEQLVAILSGITLADNPEITHELERWGGQGDPLGLL